MSSIGCICCDGYSSLDFRRETNSNTWGFSNKIGAHTFGDYYYTTHSELSGCTKHTVTWQIAPDAREQFRDNLRFVTKILDITGYIPPLCIIAGIIRIIVARKFRKLVENNIKSGHYKADLASEAIRTCEAQILRGSFELIFVIGQIINLSLDLYWYSRWNERSVGNITEQKACI